MKVSTAARRLKFIAQPLEKRIMPPDPFVQFQTWLRQANRAGLHQHNAMTLATVDIEGKPSARMVLLDEVSDQGFIFYTSYDSRKGKELAQNPQAALVFSWSHLYRQVRVEGQVTRVDDDRCDAYFAGRSRQHQLTCWAFNQSRVIRGRDELQRAVQEMRTRYGRGEIPRPTNFGGYSLTPKMIDFWQGRLDWIHDWLRYELQEDGSWQLDRLSP